MTTTVENPQAAVAAETDTNENVNKVVRSLPWEGLGKQVQGLRTAAEVIASTDLDWQVTKEPVFIQNAEADAHVVVPGQFATIRSDNRNVLGIVGDNYHILQNADAFSVFDQVADRGDAIYDTAGSLSGGKLIWLLAKIPGLMRVGGHGDELEKYLLLSNSHDGSAAIQIALTNIRVICRNTLVAALTQAGKAGTRYSIKHSGQMADKVSKATEALGLAQKAFALQEEAFNAMFDYPLSDLDAKLFIERVVAPPKRVRGVKSDILALPGDDNSEAETKEKRAVGQIAEIFLSDNPDLNAAEDKNTLWRALNAVTAFTSHFRTYKAHEKGANTKADNKLQSVFFGQSADLNQRAVTEAVRMLKEVPATVKPSVFPVGVDLSQATQIDLDTAVEADKAGITVANPTPVDVAAQAEDTQAMVAKPAKAKAKTSGNGSKAKADTKTKKKNPEPASV